MVNIREMADTMGELHGEPRADPEAQATINDFLDYTEFFPSDLFRSLTLIGKLDESYQQDAQNIHDLTKTYGTLPTIPSAERPDPQSLRMKISKTLNHAISSRESAFAEATRLCNSADTLYARLVNITEKLKALPKPPSRDPSPAPQSKSPTLSRTRKAEADKGPKIRLFVDGNRPGSSGRQNDPPRQKYSTRRIIVPGEVLPPFDPNSPGAEVSSDSESERSPTPARNRAQSQIREKIPKLKLPKIPKEPKTPRPPRPPGAMGTNVHSGVAGISVSNAMALLTAPPPNAVAGSIHAPWNELTEWELNLIRKRMKKNAVWEPSDTMKQRELARMGRGRVNYEQAKAEAEAAGVEFVCEVEPDWTKKGSRTQRDGIPLDDAEQTQILLNRGMKLNEAKKLKREQMLKEQAARDKQAQDDFVRQIAQAQSDLAMSWEEMAQLNKQVEALATPNESQKKLGKSNKKRKHQSSAGESKARTTSTSLPPIKKLKISHSSSNIEPAVSEADSPHDSETPSTKISLALPPTSAPIALRPFSGKDSKTPLPMRSTRATTQTPTPAPETAPPTTAPSRISLTLPKVKTKNKKIDSSEEKESTEQTSSTEHSSRRQSIRLTTTNTSVNTTKTSSEAATESPAPTSTAAPTAASRRGKRPTPAYVVAASGDSSAKVSLGKPMAPATTHTPTSKGTSKRTSLNSKETAAAVAQAEAVLDDVEDDEPRYCICGGISEGPMVACDNDCEKAWFHWACVGMTEMPKRTQKWYCPDCRDLLGVTESGEAVPGAKSKKKGKVR